MTPPELKASFLEVTACHSQHRQIHGAAEADCLLLWLLLSNCASSANADDQVFGHFVFWGFLRVFFLCPPRRGDGKQQGQRRFRDPRLTLPDINQRESRPAPALGSSKAFVLRLLRQRLSEGQRQ